MSVHLLSDGRFDSRLPERSQTPAAERLDEAHHAHVAEAKEEEKQERHCAPHVHARGVEDRQQEVDRKAQLQQWQQSALTFVLLALPGFVVGFFYLVFG